MLLSYRDRAFPREEERDIFREHYGRVRVADIDTKVRFHFPTSYPLKDLMRTVVRNLDTS